MVFSSNQRESVCLASTVSVLLAHCLVYLSKTANKFREQRFNIRVPSITFKFPPADHLSQGPQPSLQTCLQATRVKITVSGTFNCLNCCVIFHIFIYIYITNMTIRPPNITWLTHFPQSFQANAGIGPCTLIFPQFSSTSLAIHCYQPLDAL